MADEKDINNYFPQTLLCFIPARKEVVRVYEILSSFRLTETQVDFTFDGWERAEDFNQSLAPGSDYHFAFNSPSEPILSETQTQIIKYVTQEAAANWRVEVFLIDMKLKYGVVQIRHKSDGRFFSREIDTAEKFDKLVADYPQIVGLVQIFAWSCAKQNHEVLKHFN